MIIYTIEKKYYNDNSIDTFTDINEWKKEIDITSNEEDTRGRDSLYANIYEVEEDDTEVESGIPEDWELITKNKVEYWHLREVWAEKDKEGDLTYIGDINDDKPEPEDGGEVIEAYQSEDDIYETEEEGMECETPAQYIE